jgi:hypothetical protein
MLYPLCGFTQKNPARADGHFTGSTPSNEVPCPYFAEKSTEQQG